TDIGLSTLPSPRPGPHVFWMDRSLAGGRVAASAVTRLVRLLIAIIYKIWCASRRERARTQDATARERLRVRPMCRATTTARPSHVRTTWARGKWRVSASRRLDRHTAT